MGIRAGEGVGAGARRMQGQQAEDGVTWVGVRHLEHPGEHRRWGKLCPSPRGWQGGVGGGIRLCPCCLCAEEEQAG